jgi:tryptophan synthase alpha chain
MAVAAACDAATGFVYFVSVADVTGARTSLPSDLGAKVKAVRKRSPVPVVVGSAMVRSTPRISRERTHEGSARTRCRSDEGN